MEREVGGGIGMGNTCKPMAVSFQCMTKFTTNKKKKKIFLRNESKQSWPYSLKKIQPNISYNSCYSVNGLWGENPELYKNFLFAIHILGKSTFSIIFLISSFRVLPFGAFVNKLVCSTKGMKQELHWVDFLKIFEENQFNFYNSKLDLEIQPVHHKGDQSWVFTGRTDAEAETPILWTPDAKS